MRTQLVPWLSLLLLLLPVNANTCENSLLQADASPQDGHLSLAEFETFCNLEAKETPVLLELNSFHQAELPPELIQIYTELSDGDKGIPIEGIQSEDESLQAVVNLVCVRTRQVMAKMIWDASQEVKKGTGPFAGEAESDGLHQGNKVFAKQVDPDETEVPPEVIEPPPDLSSEGSMPPGIPASEGGPPGMGEDGSLPEGNPSEVSESGPGMEGGPPGLEEDGPPGSNNTMPPPRPNAEGGNSESSAFCQEQNVTLEICVEENMCESCEDLLDELEEPEAPDLTAIAPLEELDYNTIVTTMNAYLQEVCAFQRGALCELKACCPTCSGPLSGVFQCALEEAEAGITLAMEEMSALLAEYNDAQAIGTADEEQMELIFDCALDVCEGDDPAGGGDEDMETPTGGSDENPPPPGGDGNEPPMEGGGLDLDLCPDEFTAYRACLEAEAEACQNCFNEIGQGPVQPNYFGMPGQELPPYNEIIGLVNEHLTAQCKFFQYSVCTLRECCNTCAAELDALFACLNDVPLETQQQGIEEAYTLLGSGEPIPEDADQLSYACDLFSVNCSTVEPPPPPPVPEDIPSGEVGEAIAATKIKAAVLIANTEGLTAEAIKMEYLDVFMVALDATLNSDTFLDAVVQTLADDAGTEGGVAGAACPGPEIATPEGESAVARQGGPGMMNEGNFTARCPGTGGQGGPQGPAEMGEGMEGGPPGMEGEPPEGIPDDGQGPPEGVPGEMPEGGLPMERVAGGPPGRRRLVEDTVRALISPVLPVELFDAEVIGIEDVDCPPDTDASYTCQIVHFGYTAQTDDPTSLDRIERALRLAMDEWITGDGLQSAMPADSPFMVLGLAPPLEDEDSMGEGMNPPEGEMPIGGQDQPPAGEDMGGNSTSTDEKPEQPMMMEQPILVNSSFVMSSPDGKNAAELKANRDSQEVQALAAAYMNFVNNVAAGLGAETAAAATEMEMPEGEETMAMVSECPPAVMECPDGTMVDNQNPDCSIPDCPGEGEESEEAQTPVGGEEPPPTRQRYLRMQTRDSKVPGRIQSRRLTVTYDAESAEIYDFLDAPCSSETASVSKQAEEAATATVNATSTCIAVFGKYRIIAGPEDDVEEIYNTYVEATQASIEEGKLEEEVKATAEKQNITIPFVVEGVSPVVDNSFNAYEEIEAQATDAEEDDTTNTTTASPTASPTPSVTNTATNNNTNATNSSTEESGAAPQALSSRAFVALLAGLFTIFSFV